MMASCQPVMPSDSRWRCAACRAKYHSSAVTGGISRATIAERAFLQRAHRLARLVPLDPPIRWVRRAGVDAGDLKRLAVDPGAVCIAVGQEDRTVRDDGIERLPGRNSAGKDVHRPPAAGDPLLFRVLTGVGRDELDIALDSVGAAQVATAELVAGEDRMRVRVDDPRDQRPAVEVNGLGGSCDDVGTHLEDASVANPDGDAGVEEPHAVEDRAVVKEQIAVPHCTMMARVATFLFAPESAYGPTGNCIGIGAVLRDRGHRVVFAAEASWRGKLTALGFEEDLVDLAPPPAEDAGQDAGQFWTDYIRQTAPEFRRPTIEQLDSFVRPTWQALIDGAMHCEPQLREIVARAAPDVIVEDNVVAFPALLTAGVPFVRVVSCNPLEVPGPQVAPAYSGLPADDRSGWAAFRAEYDRSHRPMWAEFNAWVQDQGAPPLRDLQFIP